MKKDFFVIFLILLFPIILLLYNLWLIIVSDRLSGLGTNVFAYIGSIATLVISAFTLINYFWVIKNHISLKKYSILAIFVTIASIALLIYFYLGL